MGLAGSDHPPPPWGEFGWSDPARQKGGWQAGDGRKQSVDYRGIGLLEGMGMDGFKDKGEGEWSA